MNISRFARLTQRRGKTFLSKNVSSIQVIVFYYIVMTVLSLALFYLPFFREPGSHASFIDLFFMA
ncbi:MAG TPA: Ktr system potassium uptake protein D, partial [Enterococcus sp.]|nr:Ktr system potassium uptake protein D [Enterococcus sp.]